MTQQHQLPPLPHDATSGTSSSFNTTTNTSEDGTSQFLSHSMMILEQNNLLLHLSGTKEEEEDTGLLSRLTTSSTNNDKTTNLALSRREEFEKSSTVVQLSHPQQENDHLDDAVISTIAPIPSNIVTTLSSTCPLSSSACLVLTNALNHQVDLNDHVVDDDWSISLDMSRVHSSISRLPYHQQRAQQLAHLQDQVNILNSPTKSNNNSKMKQPSTSSPKDNKIINNESKFSIKSPMDSFRNFLSSPFSLSPKSVSRKSEYLLDEEIYMEQFLNWKAEQHDGVIVSWRDVVYKVQREKSWLNEVISKGLRKRRDATEHSQRVAQQQGDSITILNGIDGIAYPGSILAVMGSSGAGKSSLLNILAGQVKPTSGKVIINGLIVKQRLKSLVGYVYQEDMFMENLTVRETLRYAALLRLPSSTSYAEKMAKVDHVLQLLKLDVCADTLIGEPGLTKGISGGERKRLSIAIALLTNPPILILDEPTTCLDAKTALDVVDTISQVAKRHNITVIMTIHQPRSDIFEKLENLLLLTNGRVAYFGSTSKVCKYFKKITFKMNENYNPADFVMDLITEDTHAIFAQEKTLQSEQERISKIVQNFEEMKNKIIPSLHDTFQEYSLPKVERSSWMTQFFVMFVRGFLNQWRDFKYTKIRIVQQIIYAILVGCIYFQTKNDQNSVQNKLGLLFFVVTNQWSNSFGTPISTFRGERLYFMRERGAKCFSISSYYFGRLLADLLLIVPHPVVFGTIIYLLAGLTLTAERYLVFIFIVFILSQTSHSFGTMLAILVPRSDIATMILPPISTTFHVFSGFYRNIEQIPVWLSWFTYCSPFNYGFKALIINEFQGRRIECPENPNEICRFPTIDFILDYYGMNNDLLNMWFNIAIVFGISIGMRIIAFISLKYFVKSRKGA
ncbi:hypothetical protein FDP41_009755 [Naegleria fowleri]|uniref:ABC transporter domain-containing protein n=1 Tax=Naegleria fowleri TaxID=5763 RepID=A0A6A5BG98_NAEFO|nr:uncharacterized protein FDP41_009755 [Naegleria fowleri]KAF0972059.1 hypothetical protein FDP41_009755 [Naegleria fowleri]